MTNTIVTARGGGTGRQTLTADALLAGDGVNAVKLLTPSAAGDMPRWTGSAWLLGPPPLPRAYLAGLGLANNGTDPNNDIDIAAGAARSAANDANLDLSATLTKRLDAAWSVGSGAGGLDTGAKAINTWYFLHLIRRSDTGVVDALFSASLASPTMPANYDAKRRIGAVRTDGSGNIRAFVQLGDDFWLKAPVKDVDGTSSTTRTNFTLTVPPGAATRVYAVVSTANEAILAQSPDQTEQTPASATGLFSAFSGGATRAGSPQIVPVDASGRIALDASAGGQTWIVQTLGWFDRRGRDD